MKLCSGSFLIFLSLLSLSSFAQKEFKLTGVLVDSGLKIRIAMASVVNLRNRYQAATNDMGLFEIKTAIGDTLEITKSGYSDLKVVVFTTRSLVLSVNRGTVLNEVLIRGKSKEKAMDEIENDFRAKGTFYAGKPPLSLLSPFGGSPLTFFYELFGKTPRDARRFKRYRVNESQQTYVDQFFNRTLVQKYTGLQDYKLDQFMISYRPDYAQTVNWTDYDGVKWITDCYKKYRDTVK